MNLAYVAPFGLRPKNTTLRRVLPMARAVANHGHRVRVLVPPYDDASAYGTSWTDGDVEVVCLDRPRFSGEAGLSAVYAQVAMARQALQRLAAWRPDLIHVFKPKAVSGLVQLGVWRRRSRPPLVLDVDDWEGKEGWSQYEHYSGALVRLFDLQERAGLARCDAITAASETLAKRARTLGRGVPVLHLINGYEPAPYARWSPATDRAIGLRLLNRRVGERLVLAYTRFFEYGVDDWARAIREIAAARPDVRFVVLGAGKFGQEKDLAADLRVAGLADRVAFLGWVVFDDLAALLAACDVAMLPMADTIANRAKCSVKYIDLMIAGVPIVATPVGEALAYVRDGQTGFMATDSSPRAVSAAVLRSLDFARTAELIATARNYAVRDLAWDRLVDPLVEVYDRLVAHQSRA